MKIKENTQPLGICRRGHSELYLNQDSIFLWESYDLADENSRVAGCHTLYFSLYCLLRCFHLIFKQEIPEHCAVGWTTWQLTLTNVERIQQVAFNQFKVCKSKLFVLSLSVEANEFLCHGVFTGTYVLMPSILNCNSLMRSFTSLLRCRTVRIPSSRTLKSPAVICCIRTSALVLALIYSPIAGTTIAL